MTQFRNSEIVSTYESKARMRRCDVEDVREIYKVRILSNTFANNLIGIYLTRRILEACNA